MNLKECNILGHSGLAELRLFANQRRCLLALDFDGTLAPIVSTPKEAALAENVKMILTKLAGKMDILIISGRSVSDIQTRVSEQVKYFIGNHGLEGCGLVNAYQLATAKRTVELWVQEIENSIRMQDGLFIENKAYSLAIHYRSAQNPVIAEKVIMDVVGKIQPKAELIPGKLVLNLLPEGLPDKYQAIVHLMETQGYRSAIFIGDDYTDNRVFQAQDSKILSIKVGNSPDLKTDWYIESQNLIYEFLASLEQMRIDFGSSY